MFCSENQFNFGTPTYVHDSTRKRVCQMDKTPKDWFKDDPNVKIVGYIYETNNFDMFKKMKGNRNVDKVTKLKTSMKKHGFLNIPVVINKNYEIGDGQHREAAAESIGLPIKFCIEPDFNLDETIDVNNCQRTWTQAEKVESRAVRGNENFQRIDELHKTFSKPLNVIYAAMGKGITGGSVSGKINNGTLVCTEEEYEEAVRVLSWIRSFDDLIKANKVTGAKQNFYFAIMFARRCKEINTSILSERIRNNFSMYGTYFGNVEDVVAKTEKAYNHKVPAKSHVYILDSFRKALAESKSKALFTEKGVE